MLKQPFVFISTQINLVAFDQTGALLAFVAGNKLFLVAEIRNCQHTMVGTPLTTGIGGFDIQPADFLQ